MDRAIERGLVDTSWDGGTGDLLSTPRFCLGPEPPWCWPEWSEIRETLAAALGRFQDAADPDGRLVVTAGRKHGAQVTFTVLQGRRLEAALDGRRRTREAGTRGSLVRRLAERSWTPSPGSVAHLQRTFAASGREDLRSLASEVLNLLAEVYGIGPEARVRVGPGLAHPPG